MAEIPNKPEWLENWRRTAGTPEALPAPTPMTTPSKTRDENGRWVKGMSGNPRGKGAGTLDTRQKLQNAFADDVVDIAKVVVAKALDGDVGAANIVLSRLLPPLRQQAERVQFELNPHGPLADQANQILAAVAQGQLDPDTGKTLIGAIQSVAGIRAIEELEARILSLEAKTIG